MDPVVSLEHMFKSFVKNIHLSLHLCPNIHTWKSANQGNVYGKLANPEVSIALVTSK